MDSQNNNHEISPQLNFPAVIDSNTQINAPADYDRLVFPNKSNVGNQRSQQSRQRNRNGSMKGGNSNTRTRTNPSFRKARDAIVFYGKENKTPLHVSIKKLLKLPDNVLKQKFQSDSEATIFSLDISEKNFGYIERIVNNASIGYKKICLVDLVSVKKDLESLCIPVPKELDHRLGNTPNKKKKTKSESTKKEVHDIPKSMSSVLTELTDLSSGIMNDTTQDINKVHIKSKSQAMAIAAEAVEVSRKLKEHNEFLKQQLELERDHNSFLKTETKQLYSIIDKLLNMKKDEDRKYKIKYQDLKRTLDKQTIRKEKMNTNIKKINSDIGSIDKHSQLSTSSNSVSSSSTQPNTVTIHDLDSVCSSIDSKSINQKQLQEKRIDLEENELKRMQLISMGTTPSQSFPQPNPVPSETISATLSSYSTSSKSINLHQSIYFSQSIILLNSNYDKVFEQWIPSLHAPLRLLYRASSYGFTCSSFHSICDNKTDLIILIQATVNNVCCIFGWYTKRGWHNPPIPTDLATTNQQDKYLIIDDDCFLFTLQNPHNTKPQCFHHKTTCKYALSYNMFNGPCTCGGIYIRDQCNSTDENYIHSCFQKDSSVYEADPKYQTSLYVNSSNFFNNEGYLSDRFIVDEYEIFQLPM